MPGNKGMKVETEMCRSQLSKHSHAGENVGAYYRREVSTWFNGRLVQGVTTKSRASEEIGKVATWKYFQVESERGKWR